MFADIEKVIVVKMLNLYDLTTITPCNKSIREADGDPAFTKKVEILWLDYENMPCNKADK